MIGESMSEITKMRKIYWDFRHKLKAILFNELVCFEIAAIERMEYDENNEEIKELYDDSFEIIVDLLIQGATKKDLVDKFSILWRYYGNEIYNNQLAINNAVEKIIKMQIKAQEYALKAKEEQIKYSQNEIDRVNRINNDLDEYLRIGEKTIKENQKDL
jgi:hypothetical protein